MLLLLLLLSASIIALFENFVRCRKKLGFIRSVCMNPLVPAQILAYSKFSYN